MANAVLVATHNQGKITEFREMMQDLAFDWLGLAEAGVTFEVDETGKTLEENAILKGTAYSEATGLLTLADDSGLEVDALNGEPGVYTGRYGGRQKKKMNRLYGNMPAVMYLKPWAELGKSRKRPGRPVPIILSKRHLRVLFQDPSPRD
jgi:non-canonical purine NTP pyrophosphatase (RdgB/HAM1 family)